MLWGSLLSNFSGRKNAPKILTQENGLKDSKDPTVPITEHPYDNTTHFSLAMIASVVNYQWWHKQKGFKDLEARYCDEYLQAQAVANKTDEIQIQTNKAMEKGPDETHDAEFCAAVNATADLATA
jgi:hypothetical protein